MTSAAATSSRTHEEDAMLDEEMLDMSVPWEQAVAGATTQFWGEPVEDRRHFAYSDGNVCPLCLDEGVTTPITNGATLCKTHRNRAKAKAKALARRACQLARMRRCRQ
jgi:hypothetical protein